MNTLPSLFFISALQIILPSDLFASEKVTDAEQAYMKSWENTAGDRPEILKKAINLDLVVAAAESDESSLDTSLKRERREVFLKFANGSNGSPSVSIDDEDSVLASSIIEPTEDKILHKNNN